MDLEQNVLNMTHTKRVRWWETFRKEQASWGGLLLEPYPELLTNWYAERLLDGDILASKENITMVKRHLNELNVKERMNFHGYLMKKRAIDQFVLLRKIANQQKVISKNSSYNCSNNLLLVVCL